MRAALLITGVPMLWLLLRGRLDSVATDAAHAERRRMAHELHDVIGHRMAVIGLQARQLAGNPQVAATAVVIDELAHLAAEDIRRIVSSPREEDEALPSLLSSDIADAVSLLPPGKVSVCFENIDQERPLPPHPRRTGLRVFQEGVTNALKHGGGPIHARLDFAGDVVLSLVNDIARGTPATPASSGTGLDSLRERLAEHGGSLTFGCIGPRRYQLRATLPSRKRDTDADRTA